MIFLWSVIYNYTEWYAKTSTEYLGTNKNKGGSGKKISEGVAVDHRDVAFCKSTYIIDDNWKLITIVDEIF